MKKSSTKNFYVEYSQNITQDTTMIYETIVNLRTYIRDIDIQIKNETYNIQCVS